MMQSILPVGAVEDITKDHSLSTSHSTTVEEISVFDSLLLAYLGKQARNAENGIELKTKTEAEADPEPVLPDSLAVEQSEKEFHKKPIVKEELLVPLLFAQRGFLPERDLEKEATEIAMAIEPHCQEESTIHVEEIPVEMVEQKAIPGNFIVKPNSNNLSLPEQDGLSEPITAEPARKWEKWGEEKSRDEFEVKPSTVNSLPFIQPKVATETAITSTFKETTKQFPLRETGRRTQVAQPLGSQTTETLLSAAEENDLIKKRLVLPQQKDIQVLESGLEKFEFAKTKDDVPHVLTDWLDIKDQPIVKKQVAETAESLVMEQVEGTFESDQEQIVPVKEPSIGLAQIPEQQEKTESVQESIGQESIGQEQLPKSSTEQMPKIEFPSEKMVIQAKKARDPASDEGVTSVPITSFNKPPLDLTEIEPSLPKPMLDLEKMENTVPRLTEQISSLIQEERTEVRLQLKPERLGDLRIKLSLERGIMVAEFIVENEAVREVIASQLPQLHTALQEQGTNVGDMMVNIGYADQQKEQDSSQQNQGNPLQRRNRLVGAATKMSEQRRPNNPWNHVDLKA